MTYRFAKRALDILVSLTALVFFAPLLLMTALAIRLTSRGPVLFATKRVGLDGKVFHFVKFRTMAHSIDEALARRHLRTLSGGPDFKIKNDPRVTRVGRFLRRTSLDELPALINVLKGDMSLVGPRAILPYETEHYGELQKRRIACRPGLTGLWQVSGQRADFETMSRADVEYLKRPSFWLDFKILAKAVGGLLRRSTDIGC